MVLGRGRGSLLYLFARPDVRRLREGGDLVGDGPVSHFLPREFYFIFRSSRSGSNCLVQSRQQADGVTRLQPARSALHAFAADAPPSYCGLVLCQSWSSCEYRVYLRRGSFRVSSVKLQDRLLCGVH